MRSSTFIRISTSHQINSELVKHHEFTTKQKARIGKCLEQINNYLFECYDEPKKVYKLNDIYRVLGVMLQDGTATDVDDAINKFMDRIK